MRPSSTRGAQREGGLLGVDLDQLARAAEPAPREAQDPVHGANDHATGAPLLSDLEVLGDDEDADRDPGTSRPS